MRLSFEVSETERQHLTDLADRLNVPAEALMAASLRDLLTQREAALDAAAQHVVEKNAELFGAAAGDIPRETLRARHWQHGFART